jgi:hypothetical protein
MKTFTVKALLAAPKPRDELLCLYQLGLDMLIHGHNVVTFLEFRSHDKVLSVNNDCEQVVMNDLLARLNK